jgi:hypothetical protein
MKKGVVKEKMKLKISRETLRVLETPQLVAAEGNVEASATVRYSNCGSCNTGLDIPTA